MPRIITGYQTDCIFYEMKSEIKNRTTLIGRVYERIKALKEIQVNCTQTNQNETIKLAQA